MPRRRSEPRIWLDPARRTWTILDGRKRVRTGFFENEELEASEALSRHIYHERCKVDNNPPSRRRKRSESGDVDGRDLISLTDAAKRVFRGRVDAETLRQEIAVGRLPGWNFGARMFTSLQRVTELYDQITRLKRTDLGKGVYVIGYDNYVKIGITQGIKSRLETIQTSIPAKLEVYAMFDGWRRDELMLHKRFAAYRLQGEWFRREGELAEWIDGGCK